MERSSIDYFKRLPIGDCQEETKNCIIMWRHLLDLLTEDLINEPQDAEEWHDKGSAQVWFSRQIPYGALSNGFDDVCDLADLPGSFVHIRIEKLIKLCQSIE